MFRVHPASPPLQRSRPLGVDVFRVRPGASKGCKLCDRAAQPNYSGLAPASVGPVEVLMCSASASANARLGWAPGGVDVFRVRPVCALDCLEAGTHSLRLLHQQGGKGVGQEVVGLTHVLLPRATMATRPLEGVAWGGRLTQGITKRTKVWRDWWSVPSAICACQGLSPLGRSRAPHRAWRASYGTGGVARGHDGPRRRAEPRSVRRHPMCQTEASAEPVKISKAPVQRTHGDHPLLRSGRTPATHTHTHTLKK